MKPPSSFPQCGGRTGRIRTAVFPSDSPSTLEGARGRFSAIRIGALALVLIALFCVWPVPAEQVHKDKHTDYSVANPPPGWNSFKLTDVDLAFNNEATGASIMINSTCEMEGPVPLIALTNHLLLDIIDRKIKTRRELEIDGRIGLATIMTGRLEGFEMQMDLRVVQIDSCVYDLVYLAPLGKFDEAHQDFETITAGFHARRINTR